MIHTKSKAHQRLSSNPMRRMMLAVVALVAFAAVCIMPRGEASEQTPGQLVQSSSQRVIRTLSERRTEFQSNPVTLHSFIRSELTTLFDRDEAARLVLGRNGRTASDAEVRAFADALGENLMNRYGASLLAIDPGLNVKLTSETPLRNGTIIKVMSLIDRKNGAPMAVDYLFHQHDGHWQMFDVIVEGVSLVQTFRTQFGDDLRTRTLAQITDDLRAGKIKADARIATPAKRQ